MIPRPPTCQGCVQNAAVYFTLVAGGKAETYACCQGCPSLLSDSILPSLALGLKLTVPTPVGRGKCPTCGFRWADFDRIHRLGCPTCYEAHAPQALATIARMAVAPPCMMAVPKPRTIQVQTVASGITRR